MKTYRLDMSRGVNVVADKAIMQPGYVTVADGVDLRSGLVRPFPGHVYLGSTSSTYTCLFSYRDYLYPSVLWRDYITETIGSQDRLYFTEYGEYSKKTIEGATIKLGQIPPRISPIASSVNKNNITLSVSVSGTGGTFVSGTYRSYRVAARTEKGVQPPSYAVIANFPSATEEIKTNSATLAWEGVQDAIGYLIFAGQSGAEALAKEVGPTIFSVTDDGSWPSGDLAKNYDDKYKYNYVYTFERDFKGQKDESGPSPVSVPVDKSYNRKLIFNMDNEGYWDNETLVTVTGSFTITQTSSIPTPTVTSLTFNNYLSKTYITLSASIGLRTGDYLMFTLPFIYLRNTTDYYQIETLEDDKHICINSIVDFHGSEDIVAGLATASVKKTYIEWDESSGRTEIIDRDIVKVKITTGTFEEEAVYESRLETPSGSGKKKISIPKVTNDVILGPATVNHVKYVPSNAYLRTRNLYRTAPAGGWALVEKIPIYQLEYMDRVPTGSLGDTPTSYYLDNGVQVIFAPPPLGLTGLTAHYGMAFGIDGIRVRWTPRGVYDAWPEAFYQEFPSQPLALASFAGALIVLCENGIYRLDGTLPSQLVINGTTVRDGCIAPHSVQVTSDAGLLYLSKRGIMAFDGMNARCITDASIPARFWSAPSYLDGDSADYGLLPTLSSHNYAGLAYEDGIKGDVTIGYAQHCNNPASGIIADARSFVWNGRYFLYWANASGNYGAHTTICLDLRKEGYPITSLPYRLKAACSSETGKVFAILRDTGPGTTEVYISHEEAP